MMSGMNLVFLIMAVVYIALGVTIGLFISMRSRRKKSAVSTRNKDLPVNSAVDSAFTVNGRYEMRSPAYKQGGMATIWLGAERKTGSPCIIKTPRRGTAMDNVYLDKLMLEASYLKKLKHPGIVKYLDQFYYKGEFYLIIEYLTGDTLLTSSMRSAFREQQVVYWACQLLDALSYLHSCGIVHRDINPKNIMLCNDATVKLIDFGTAKTMNGKNAESETHDPFTQITNKGFDIPELFTGDESDQRSDLCGLAQTCIYLLTLRHPNEICLELFKHQWPRSYGEAKILADYLTAEGISNRTAKWLAQGILFSPDKRFADARAMKAALSSIEGYLIEQGEVYTQK